VTLNSLIPAKNSLFLEIFSLLICVGNWAKSDYGSALRAFYHYVKRIWLRTLRRRSQKDRFSWQRMHGLAADWLPQPRILHPYPDKRFAVMHPRWEPCAGIPPARIWAGCALQAR
jgi:hypothetical protein